jgi:hypothetical protein
MEVLRDHVWRVLIHYPVTSPLGWQCSGSLSRPFVKHTGQHNLQAAGARSRLTSCVARITCIYCSKTMGLEERV